MQLSVGLEEGPWEEFCGGQWLHTEALCTCAMTAGPRQQHTTVVTARHTVNTEAANILKGFLIQFKYSTLDDKSQKIRKILGPFSQF